MLRRALLLRSGAEAMVVETRRNYGEDGRDGCCNGNGGTGAAMAAAGWLRVGGGARRRWWRRGEACAICGGGENGGVAVVAVLVVAAAGFAHAFSGVKVVTEQWRHCCSGVVVGEVGAAAAAMVVEGEKKSRVRVLGVEEDDVAAFQWTAC
ncbi:hypothetical protein DEO72_LG6g951 [Vigna unguiculata]|uniref:Uncharacterized protein n=1 Tax=Vigna unguiculata TaxID=3917 RepID=A0A4D6M4J6_VIGUN|nr:hypothetical protein DEO72_LG6g951 [Vigna unguiculata]